MPVSQWQPENSNTISIDAEQLKKFSQLPLDNLTTQLSEQDKEKIQAWIKSESANWLKPCEVLSDSELLNMIQFFTLAESLPGCQAGDKSCVIALVKIYRARGLKIEREFLQWIKANTDNKFLPNGPL